MLNELLQQEIDRLTALVRARYGAIGLVNDSGKLTQFIATGITRDEARRIGHLPEGEGLLGVVIHENQLLRVDDIRRDPRAKGFPPNHPPMKSLLAAPIAHQGVVYGRLYLSDKTDGTPFNEQDEEQAKRCAESLAPLLAYQHRLAEQEQISPRGKSQMEYRALLESLDEIIYVVGAAKTNPFAGRVQFVSDAVVRILGYRPREFIEDPGLWFRLVHPDDIPVLRQSTQRLIEQKVPVTREYRLRHKETGEYRWMEDKVAPQLDDTGEIAGMVGLARDATERKRIEAQRHELSSAVEQTADSVIITDCEGIIEYVNPAFETITGYRRDEAIGLKPNLVKSGLHDAAFYRGLWDTIRRGQPFRAVFTNRRKDGTLYYEEKTITPLKDSAGRITRFVSTGKDITERKQAEERIARLGRLLDDSSNEIYIFDAATLRFVQVNQGARRNLGYSLDQMKSMTPLDLKIEFSRDSFETLLAPLRRGDTEILVFETVHRRQDGSQYPVEVRLQLSRTETPPVFVAFIQDITERRQTQEHLHHLAHYDALTGLPNRLLLQDRLKVAIGEADRGDRLVAVMLLDLDRFKIINDTLGHEVGDALLQSVAERLKACIRAGDTISRLGGDEFTIVLANVAHVDDVGRVAQKIIDSFTSPFAIAGRELFMSPSIGITLYPHDDNHPENLLRNADAAMYHAKELGRNTFQFFTAELNRRTAKRLRLETALRHALERHELLLHYQPQVSLKTGRITGVEALLRWQHLEMGLVPPLEFISVAEDTGLIVPIGEWVLRTACRQAQAWNKAGFPGLQVAVNLSGRQFQHQNLARLVKTVLKDTRLDPRQLDLELTESLLMHNSKETLATMNKLHALGVAFSLDDFGTGYSSLSYLKRFPIDSLKIDQSFMRDIPTDPDDAAIAKAIIAMAHSLGIRVIAEGVETAKQLAFLRARHCDSMQGYYFSKPVTADLVTQLLGKDTCLARRQS